MLAIFASPRAIFFRRYVLGPCLKLAAVLFVISAGGSVHLLAVCYLIAGFLGRNHCPLGTEDQAPVAADTCSANQTAFRFIRRRLD